MSSVLAVMKVLQILHLSSITGKLPVITHLIYQQKRKEEKKKQNSPAGAGFFVSMTALFPVFSLKT